MNDVYVLPRKETLGQHGTVWESLLDGQGWNDMEVKTPGKVSAFYEPDGMWMTVDWPEPFHTGDVLIAIDEVMRVNPDGSKYEWTVNEQ